MRIPISALLTLACAAGLGVPGASLAFGDGTPDEAPPAEETVCEDAGLRGAAFGLCVAYCEANDCDTYGDSEACDRLWENYTKITGEQVFPCDDGA
jgi:hypothetical protein